MTAREYLDQIRVQSNRITNLQHDLEELREILLPSGMSYQEHVQSSPDLDPYGTWISRLEEKETEIKHETVQLFELKWEMIEKIHQLDDARYSQVLYLRYVQLMQFQDIADKMGYSVKHALRLCKSALEAFEHILS